MAFYENYVKLCNSVGKSPSAVAVELKLGKPSVTRWKNGAEPRDATLQKIADHFGVTVDFLKGEEQTNFYMRYCAGYPDCQSPARELQHIQRNSLDGRY